MVKGELRERKRENKRNCLNDGPTVDETMMPAPLLGNESTLKN